MSYPGLEGQDAAQIGRTLAVGWLRLRSELDSHPYLAVAGHRSAVAAAMDEQFITWMLFPSPEWGYFISITGV